jgi:hypothetical protein
MKKYFSSLAMLLASTSTFAQVTVEEPEFINSYCILTSDSTYAALPKESGSIGKHQNKVKKWSKLLGGAANIAGAAGMIGIGTAGSMSGVVTGARVMTTASGVGRAAGTVSSLAGSAGMDVIFKGGHSTYSVQGGQDVRLLIKGENNETDPLDTYRIVRFNASKKERRIQWMEFESSLLGTDDTKKAGYVSFSGHKYGEQSYLLTIPASELEKGEYGVFYMSIITATAIPVGTFSVQ